MFLSEVDKCLKEGAQLIRKATRYVYISWMFHLDTNFSINGKVKW